VSGGLVRGLAAGAGRWPGPGGPHPGGPGSGGPGPGGPGPGGPGPGGPRPDHSVGGPFLLCPARLGSSTMPCYSCQDRNN
jgi:hypothetical protein